ncbi:MAG: DEAD/DEAH box helicase family protein [Prevotella sp.]|uniref:type III restriction-modification system endonuclease n=1 Tax=Prevotella sp. TaxID=59823 RepID=UPI0025F8E5D8|nr:DEAD/DEAH box helicase family protein [Prevotella sp.]MCI7119623.1 DEAD/DEAH box helicase family protein [Prevotella sp.]
MQIRYKHQRFQTEAARSIVNAFIGQPKSDGQSDHTVDQGRNRNWFKLEGFGNKNVVLAREAICDNVRAVQTEQGIKPVDYLQDLQGVGMAFTIEMETGTGKTYTYIKTMYELNERYGWTKFIVVVPSIAIREGVLKSFESMQEHFAQEYNGKRMQYFVYNSKQLSKIDAFASNAGMHVMIINTQAFNSSMNEEKSRGARADKAARIIFDRRDEFGSRRPIDVLSQCHPIMIIDEPQSVLGVDKKNKTRKGLAQFAPLFTLLYSATHRKDDIYNMMYRLDAIDAYNQKLVKKIEVKGIKQIGSTATNGYVYLEEIVIGKGNPQARLSFDAKTGTGVKQACKLVSEGFDLWQNSGELAEYDNNFVVERIDGLQGCVRFVNGLVLHEGEAVGSVNEDYIRRIQIRETIRTHIERERQLYGQNIKVLSLFFIDHIDSYRLYDSEDTKGKFAKMFEEEYARVLSEMMPTFTDEAYLRYLSDPRNAPSKVHQGYFSMDKKGKAVDSKDKEGENEERAFDLIMKDKERLLSFKEPVRFIFSHSALKEGWDNPNVFQICTLKNSDNETKKRQEVGRGMRLCVNQNGERQDADVLGEHVFDTNILTVIASESYEDFAKALQTEMAEACSDRPIIITPNLFAGKTYTKTDGSNAQFDLAQARAVYNTLVRNNYVDDDGALTAQYYEDKRNGTLCFDKVDDMKDGIIAALDTIFDPSAVKPEDARKPKMATFQKANFEKKEFQQLWKRINQRTYYQVDFDTTDLVKKAVKALDDKLKVTEIRIVVEGGSLDNVRDKEALQAGVAMTQGNTRTIHVMEAIGRGVAYDLIGKLVSATGLTRKTIVAILKGIQPSTFSMFKMNPEEFIIKAGLIINDCKALAVIQCIRYEKLNDEFSTDIFTENMLRGKLGINAIESTKSLYDLVVLDSMNTEKHFAESLEHEDDVVVYTKLPNGFYINTPMGKYNPDWAVAFREGSVKHVYFVAETKGDDLRESQIRGSEGSKIECARRHFKAISDNGYIYDVVEDYKSLYALVAK